MNTAPAPVRALARLGGALPLPPEIAYRLPALLAGLALVPVLGRLAGALGAPAPIPLLVVWLAAGAPALVYYSRELRSHGFDALVAALATLSIRGWSGRPTVRLFLMVACSSYGLATPSLRGRRRNRHLLHFIASTAFGTSPQGRRF